MTGFCLAHIQATAPAVTVSSADLLADPLPLGPPATTVFGAGMRASRPGLGPGRPSDGKPFVAGSIDQPEDPHGAFASLSASSAAS